MPFAFAGQSPAINQKAEFVLAADALRHLVSDPLLPPELEPEGWPAARLRERYAAFLTGYQAGLRAFFKAQLASG